MKKLITMIGAAAMSFGLFASTTFSSSVYDDIQDRTPGDSNIVGSEENGAIHWWDNAYTQSGYVQPAVVTNDTVLGEKYLDVETDGSPLLRTFDAVTTGDDDKYSYDDVNIENHGLFIDTKVRMTGFESDPTPQGDSKLLVWLKAISNEEASDGNGVTNLMVTCGSWDQGEVTPTNYMVSAEGLTVQPEEWVRLTIRADKDTKDNVAKFKVFVNGIQVKAIVDDDAGLEVPRKVHNAFRIPVLASLSVLPGIGEVKPGDGDLAVIRQQLAYLVLHVLPVDAHVATLVHRHILLRVIPPLIVLRVKRMIDVNRKLRVVPVNQRVVQTDAQTFRTKRVHILPDDVLTIGRIRNLVVRVLGIPQAETLVMLRGQDDVLHARRLRDLRPRGGIVQVWVELLEIAVIVGLRNRLRLLHPLATRRRRIQSEVDEHPESALRPPRHFLGYPLRRQVRGQDKCNTCKQQSFCSHFLSFPHQSVL